MTTPTLLTLREAAERLGVDYNTVYRLVRSGKLPAARSGSLYHLRAEDVDAYPAQQSAPTGADDLATGDGAATAVERAVETADAPAAAVLRCGYCLRLIQDGLPIAGVCLEATCEELLCRDCRERGRTLCRRHAPSPAEKLAAAEQAHHSGLAPAPLTAAAARRRERNFLQRFAQKVESQTALPHPAGGPPVRIADWPAIGATIEAPLPPGAAFDAPRNARRRYSVAAAAGRSGFALEARVIARRDAFLEDGFDAPPLDAAALLPLLDACAAEAAAGGLLLIVGLAAVTGWSADALRLLAGPRLGEGWVHPLVWPCLIDLEARAPVGQTPPGLQPYLPYFRLPLPEEEARAVEEYVRQKVLYRRGDSLTAGAIAEALGVTLDAVHTAFARLQAEGSYEVHEFDEYGRVIAHA